MINLYSVLHLNADATKEQISEAYHLRKHMTNDRNTLWLIEEAYTLLMNDENRIKYDALIFKAELAKKQHLIDNKSISTISQAEMPKLLQVIIWLFSFECGSIIFRISRSIITFAVSTEANFANNLVTIFGILGLFATSIPVVIALTGLAKRFKIALYALMIVAILHLIRNVISLFMFNMVVDSEILILLPIIGLVLLIIASFNKQVNLWLNQSVTGNKLSIFVFAIFSIIYMIIFAMGMADMRKQVKHDSTQISADMKFLGTSAGKYYYYLDLSRKIIPLANGYVIPLVITDVEDNQSQHQTNVVIDSNMQKFCMEDGRKDCNNQNSFQHYELTSPIGEAVQFIERSNESN